MMIKECVEGTTSTKERISMKKNVFLALFLVLAVLACGALAAEYTYDPAKPYNGVMVGELNNVVISGNETSTGSATYYLPDGLTPWAQAAIILTPNGTTAEAFADSEIGEQWKALADEYKIAITFLAPVSGEWNLALDPAGADDGAVISQLYFTMQSMVEESRWWEIAEKENFIVIFPQGMVRDLPAMGNVPCAMWLGGGFSALAQDLDPNTDINVLNTILDMTEETYNVDRSRIYITGHSNGSMMTLSLAAANAERFAAIAPIAGLPRFPGTFLLFWRVPQ